MRFKILILILLISLNACNLSNNEVSNQDQINFSDTINNSIDSNSSTLDIDSSKKLETEITNPIVNKTEPITEISRKLKTDENFKDYYEIQVKNNTKKTITNILTEDVSIFSNTKQNYHSELINNRIIIPSGKTKSIKVYSGMYTEPKILTLRFSNGDTYNFGSLPSVYDQ